MNVTLITDRTLADAQYAALHRDSAVPLKGAYNAEDYNRVGMALNYLSGWLFDLGYGSNHRLRENWATTENMPYADASAYLAAVKLLRQSFFVLPSTPPLPDNIHDLFDEAGFVWANNIETMFGDIEYLIRLMLDSFFMCGEIMSGEV